MIIVFFLLSFFLGVCVCVSLSLPVCVSLSLILQRSGQAAEKDSEKIFTDLISHIETRRREVKQLIRAQQGAAVSQAEGQVERLEQEIAELRRRDAELEQLSHTEDNIHFLQVAGQP